MKSLIWILAALSCALPGISLSNERTPTVRPFTGRVFSARASLQWGTSAACPEPSDGFPIPAFHLVSPGICRGGRPDEAGLKVLAAHGVKTDIILDNDDAVNAEEVRVAQQLGLRVLLKPLSAFYAPADKDVEMVLRVLADPKNYPIFIHCHYGRDRTGLLIGLHRVFTEKWEPRQAHDEMMQMGFHRSLVFLNRYFEKKTGFED